MALVKAKGNMYDWVTHMHAHLGGKCPHECPYCYVQTANPHNRFAPSEKYKGKPRLLAQELLVGYGEGKTIFIEHMNDLFAEGIDPLWIGQIFAHTKRFPGNDYVFQTKNPKRAFQWYANNEFPEKFMLGTTIETNRIVAGSKAPIAIDRMAGIMKFRIEGVKTFVTIEPIMDFDTADFLEILVQAKPDFINIGADSKKCNLPEPSNEKVKDLIFEINKAGLTIRKKHNLERMLI